MKSRSQQQSQQKGGSTEALWEKIADLLSEDVVDVSAAEIGRALGDSAPARFNVWLCNQVANPACPFERSRHGHYRLKPEDQELTPELMVEHCYEMFRSDLPLKSAEAVMQSVGRLCATFEYNEQLVDDERLPSEVYEKFVKQLVDRLADDRDLLSVVVVYHNLEQQLRDRKKPPLEAEIHRSIEEWIPHLKDNSEATQAKVGVRSS